MTNQQAAIVVTSVRKAFKSVVAVQDVSFSVNRGEIFGLLGPNGAGKTTLIRLIMDILRPDAGTIEVLGHHLTEADKGRIGYLPEERGLYTKQKVLFVIEYFARLKGLSAHEARKSGLRWLEKLGMSEHRDKKIRELSKGNQQKIQLVATLATEPDILILDEPFSGLDPVNARMLMAVIRELAADGKTILLSTHQMSLVETLCQRVFMINRGQRVLYGELDELQRQHADHSVLVHTDADFDQCGLVARHVPENKAVKVYLRDGVRPRELLVWLLEQGATVKSFEEATTPLEDIFVKLVETRT